MSNQVFANSFQRYYDFPGFDEYVVSSPSPVLVPSGSFPLNTRDLQYFDHAINTNSNNIIAHQTLSSTIFQIVKCGMYSISATYEYETDGNATVDSTDTTLQLLLTRPGDPLIDNLIISESSSREPPISLDTGGLGERVTTLTTTLYLRPFDQILSRVINNSSSGPATFVFQTTTKIIINKLY